MSDRVRIEREPANPLLPYTHLLPLVQALVDRGNPVVTFGPRGELFAPSQGGYVAYLAHRIDWPWLVQHLELPDSLVYDEEDDEITDRVNWVTVLGSQG